MAISCAGVALANVKERSIYVIPGRCLEVFVLNLMTQKFYHSVQLSQQRYSHSCTSLGDSVYVFGGLFWKRGVRNVKEDAMAGIEVLNIACSNQRWQKIFVEDFLPPTSYDQVVPIS